MKIDLATDEPSMKAALELAEQFDQHTGFTGPASSPSRRDLTHAVSRARSGLVEMAAEDARRRERQALGLPDIEYPKEFLCPIGCEPMRDPVAASDGFTYERANIERWLKDHNTSPKVGGPSIPSPRALNTYTRTHSTHTPPLTPPLQTARSPSNALQLTPSPLNPLPPSTASRSVHRPTPDWGTSGSWRTPHSRSLSATSPSSPTRG